MNYLFNLHIYGLKFDIGKFYADKMLRKELKKL